MFRITPDVDAPREKMKISHVSNLRSVTVALALVTVPAGAAPLKFETAQYESGGHFVAVDIVGPGGSGRHPAILLLHGRGGMTLYGPDFRHRAEVLASKAFVVLVPHYFDASASADSPDVTAKLFETWRKAVADAVGFAERRGDVYAPRIGLVGVSLGGYLAAVEAVQDDRVAALVSESAGVSTWFPRHPHRMPPLLIVHSRDDPIAPLSDAMHLAELARSLQAEPVMAIYDGNDHVLTGAAARAADERISDFLADALRLPDP
jgi:carboxymethylenebutenolidase